MRAGTRVQIQDSLEEDEDVFSGASEELCSMERERFRGSVQH